MPLTRREVPPPASIAEGSTNCGARGCSLESYVTSVTDVTKKYKTMILKVLLGCHIPVNSTIREVLQELQVLHVAFSRSGTIDPGLKLA